ncbi:uncharacterized protein V6R79_023302 [Siganus canaliculatus]
MAAASAAPASADRRQLFHSCFSVTLPFGGCSDQLISTVEPVRCVLHGAASPGLVVRSASASWSSPLTPQELLDSGGGGRCHHGLKHLLNNAPSHVTGSEEAAACMKHFGAVHVTCLENTVPESEETPSEDQDGVQRKWASRPISFQDQERISPHKLTDCFQSSFFLGKKKRSYSSVASHDPEEVAQRGRRVGEAIRATTAAPRCRSQRLATRRRQQQQQQQQLRRVTCGAQHARARLRGAGPAALREAADPGAVSVRRCVRVCRGFAFHKVEKRETEQLVTWSPGPGPRTVFMDHNI